MAEDIVTRLNIAAGRIDGLTWHPTVTPDLLYADAADEIERLRAELLKCDQVCHFERLEATEWEWMQRNG